ncbi:conserved hypothetical protein [Perkinsus marinus ATCC 50983]|uniref:Guanylate cyclase domain-containing protein n=2 Tax=Perkinsus marinus (strain ATCC 50983 / TXsc) TaxID=423536 RepID=C5LSQ7_PERM5|nr:conserved hypothetical protein [Perkinsus marinus ATCC 50983]EER00298.1 conserved hypothetical protein [Perkinsus marinus ATCC 50983]|eukprot:XP_002767580.1 conserved hypothetical protein [Perkinsus marinus ATCC 50983]
MLPEYVVDSIIDGNRDLAARMGCDARSLFVSRKSPLISRISSFDSKALSALEIGTFARRCGDVTVLFCDVADFPQLVAALTPKQLILILHRLFSKIDKLVFVHALTKLETVAESYVVCSGLNPDSDSSDRVVSKDAFRTVLLGLDILDNTAYINVLTETDHENLATGSLAEVTPIALVMKIGIHTGPVISGVVGSRRPQFCIFGDTINTASRMKSTAVPNCIHLSASTRKCLEFSPSLSFEERETFVKGKGMLVTYNASRAVGPLQDAGVSSPTVSRAESSAAAISIPIGEKVGRLASSLKRSRSSASAPSVSASATLAERLSAGIKRFVWRSRRTVRTSVNDTDHSSVHSGDEEYVSYTDSSAHYDESRDVKMTVEALRRRSKSRDANVRHVIEYTDLGRDRANLFTLEFLQRAHEIEFAKNILRHCQPLNGRDVFY